MSDYVFDVLDYVYGSFATRMIHDLSLLTSFGDAAEDRPSFFCRVNVLKGLAFEISNPWLI